MASRLRISAIILVIVLALLHSSSCTGPTTTPTATPPATAEPAPARPQETPTLQVVATPTPAGETELGALLRHLPAESVVIEAAAVRVADGREPLVVTLLGYERTPDRLGYGQIELAALDTSKSPGASIVWTSGPTIGERAEALQVRDINGDGADEVLSIQSTGATAEVLYVLGFASGAAGWLKPVGGKFDGQDYFGEVAARLEDLDGDGLLDILASYGPAATYTDVYHWNGSEYEFVVTLQDK